MRDTRSHNKLCCVRRNFTGEHTAAALGVHASLQELDPPRGGQTLRRVLLGSRVQLRTCQSGLQHIGAPTVSALILAHSSTERRQPATSNCWLALHRLERGGAARASQGSRNVFWRRENCFHQAQPRSLTRQMPRRKPPTVIQKRT